MPEAPTEYSLHDLCSMVDALEKRSNGLLRLLPSVGRGLMGMASKAKGMFSKAPAAAEAAGTTGTAGVNNLTKLMGLKAAPGSGTAMAANAAKWNKRLGWGATAAFTGQALTGTADVISKAKGWQNPLEQQQIGAERAMTEMAKQPLLHRLGFGIAPQWALQKYVDSKTPEGYMTHLLREGVTSPVKAYEKWVGDNAASNVAKRTIDNIRPAGSAPLYPGIQRFYDDDVQRGLINSQMGGANQALIAQLHAMKKQLAALQGTAQTP